MPTRAAQAALDWLQAHGAPPRDAHEALALAVHALLVHHGFRPAETAADAVPAALPADWGGAGFGGRYRHARSAMTFDIRAVRMGGRLLIHAAAAEDDARLHTVDVRVEQYVAARGDRDTANDTANDTAGGGAWADALTRLDDLATLVAVQIAHRLVPDAAKPGYEDAAAADAADGGSSGVGAGGASAPTPRPVPGPRPVAPGRDDPLRDPTHDPLRDPLHDPLRIGRPRRPHGLPGEPGMPFGADDLLPPGLQPGAGGMFGRGGNLMGPGNFPGGAGRGGRLPPGVPPGARFDPYYPVPDNDAEMPPGFEDEHGLRQPPQGRGGGGGGGRGRGGGPPDDGPPPGMYW